MFCYSIEVTTHIYMLVFLYVHFFEAFSESPLFISRSEAFLPIPSLLKEKEIMERDYFTGSYPIFAYFGPPMR